MALFLVRYAARPRPLTYEHDGGRFALDTDTRRRSEMGTRFGKVAFVRAVGRPIGGRRRTDLPIDRELGVCSGFSLGTVTAVVQLCALMAFGTARRLFAEFHEWAPSSRSTLRMVDAVGAEARGFLDADAAPDDDGEVLVIQVDGRGAPMISATEHARRCQRRRKTKGTKRHGRRLRRREHPRPRRKKGDKSKNAKVAFVGVIYTLRATRHGWEDPSTSASSRPSKATRRSFAGSPYTPSVAVTVASAASFSPTAPITSGETSRSISRRLWRASTGPRRRKALGGWRLSPSGGQRATSAVGHRATGQAATWQGRRRARRHGHGAQRDSKTGPGNKGRRKRLLAILEYLTAHEQRMPYAALRRDDLDIGTGAVEGAVRNLVGLRLDEPACDGDATAPR